MSKSLIIITILFSMSVSAQKGWYSLGGAEKVWVIFHPFSAKKAQKLSLQVLQEMDSLKKNNIFKGNTLSGSKADALRHAYWMSLLSYHIGPKRAIWLGKAHEKKNEKDFEKKVNEEGYLPDLVANQMDLKNNRQGADLGDGCIVCTDKQLLETCFSLLKNGSLVYIKQNKEGEFLDYNDKVIPTSEWVGTWKNKRILWPTDL